MKALNIVHKVQVKLLLLIVIAICATINANSQDKIWEHNIYLSVGKYIGTGTSENRIDKNYTVEGLTLKLGYGLNRYFTESFSVMSGLAIHCDIESAFENYEGGDEDCFSFIDIPVTAQYHIALDCGKLLLGFGPVFGFCIDRDKYYYDADPGHPLNDKSKIKPFNLSLMPCIAYETKHIRFGIDGSLGVLDVQDTHGLITDSKHLHNVCATIGVKF